MSRAIAAPNLDMAREQKGHVSRSSCWRSRDMARNLKVRGENEQRLLRV